MMTQTHVLVAAALFARPGQRTRTAAALMGGFVPDLPIYALFVWSKLAGVPETIVWRELYWRDPWDSLTTWFNSFPLYAAIALLAHAMMPPVPVEAATATDLSMAPEAIGRRSAASRSRWADALAAFGLAAISHLVGDFFVHVEDAHSHFWPFHLWRFRSAISYWDPAYYGDWFSLVETLLGIGLAVVLFRRFRALLPRVLLGLLIAGYVAVPVYFAAAAAYH